MELKFESFIFKFQVLSYVKKFLLEAGFSIFRGLGESAAREKDVSLQPITQSDRSENFFSETKTIIALK